MLYSITSRVKHTSGTLKGMFTYHKFIVSAPSIEEVKKNFKASKPSHEMLEVVDKLANIMEVSI